MVHFAMAETWLPQEPPPAPPPRSAARRTVFLWLGFIALFLIIYAVMDSSSSSTHAGPRTHDDGALPWWLWALCVGCFAVPTGLFVWLIGTSRRFNTQLGPAYKALGDGDHARAAQLFGDLARRFRAKPNVWPAAAYNQAHALIRMGDSAAAVGVLLGIHRMPDLGIDGIRGLAALQLARAFAIGGDLDKAQRWLDAGRTGHAAFGDPGQEYAQRADVEGLVLCRAGKLEDALRHYDQTWERLQSRLTVNNMRAVWLLRAFAATSVSSPRHAAAAETWLRLLRATNPGSLAWLTDHWPELAAFAATHDLGVAAPRAAASAEASTARA
jgi:tetratricopeptide (TPR) repeat protein